MIYCNMYGQVTVQVKQVIRALEDCPYVILRLGAKFPTVSSLQDVDLLTTEPQRVKSIIGQNIRLPFTVRTRTVKPGVQWHLDLHQGHRFLFKFDIYRDLRPCYVKVKLHPDCSQQIVASRIVTEREGVKINVPKLPVDLALRYLEYVERPKKVRHLRYVEQFPEVDFVRVQPGEEGVLFD